MAELAQQGDKLNVFISYSRADLVFADQLYAALGALTSSLALTGTASPAATSGKSVSAT
jgi:hypothetical protein